MQKWIASLTLSLLCLSSAAQSERLNAGGSSFVYPMMSKWASEFAKINGDEINYQSVGSGGGIQQMTQKVFDFGATDGPMNEEQLQKAKDLGGEVIHVPLVMGAVVPAYNLEGVSQAINLSGPVLAEIFLGKIKNWNDAKIAKLNSGVKLPNEEITVVHRSDGSGTTYIWADYLSKVSPDWKTTVGVGSSLNWPAGVGQKGNEGVAGEIKRSPGSIGYVELIYALQNNLAFAQVENKSGKFVKATLESVTAAAKNALPQIPDDLRYSITDAPGEASYPISGTTWAVLYTNGPGTTKAKNVVEFLRWATHDGQKFTKDLHYAPLPETLINRIDKKLGSVKVAG